MTLEYQGSDQRLVSNGPLLGWYQNENKDAYTVKAVLIVGDKRKDISGTNSGMSPLGGALDALAAQAARFAKDNAAAGLGANSFSQHRGKPKFGGDRPTDSAPRPPEIQHVEPATDAVQDSPEDRVPPGPRNRDGQGTAEADSTRGDGV